ncbi:MAG: hypothetical protein LIO46_01825 [Clostridiales bacterium]|nr:hypothetical protein [Clostridiales bacterium]
MLFEVRNQMTEEQMIQMNRDMVDTAATRMTLFLTSLILIVMCTYFSVQDGTPAFLFLGAGMVLVSLGSYLYAYFVSARRKARWTLRQDHDICREYCVRLYDNRVEVLREPGVSPSWEERIYPLEFLYGILETSQAFYIQLSVFDTRIIPKAGISEPVLDSFRKAVQDRGGRVRPLRR